MKLLKDAKRPVIIAGNGIRLAGAYNVFKRFLENVECPVVTSFDSKDLLSGIDFQNMGTFGINGDDGSNDVVQSADLLLILGCRMNVRQTGYDFGRLGKNAIKIMVDIDETELNKYTFVPDIKVKMDIGIFLGYMNMCMKEQFTYSDWTWQAGQIYGRLFAPYHYRGKPPTLAEFCEDLSAALVSIDNSVVVVCANGVIANYTAKYLDLRDDDRYIINSGCGSMGYGLPAAIGAALASNKTVICLEGDGSLQLNIQELQTMKSLNLPIKLFVINNGGYVSIKSTQENYFNGNYVGCDYKTGVEFPDLRLIAKAYGLRYTRIMELNSNEERLVNIIKNPYPRICEVFVDTEDRPSKAEISEGIWS